MIGDIARQYVEGRVLARHGERPHRGAAFYVRLGCRDERRRMDRAGRLAQLRFGLPAAPAGKPRTVAPTAPLPLRRPARPARPAAIQCGFDFPDEAKGIDARGDRG